MADPKASSFVPLATKVQTGVPTAGMFLDGEDTYFSRTQAQSVNQLDNVSFLRHGDIDEQIFGIKLDFIRDFRNVLGLLSSNDSIEFMEQLERDTNRQNIAKLATFKMLESGEYGQL